MLWNKLELHDLIKTNLFQMTDGYNNEIFLRNCVDGSYTLFGGTSDGV